MKHRHWFLPNSLYTHHLLILLRECILRVTLLQDHIAEFDNVNDQYEHSLRLEHVGVGPLGSGSLL